ncbi:serine/threonine-protein kinase [Pseudofrankia sp. BMG5.36]|uniref:WD40 repeat domain-containing serine/threonine protein kinase n=1 Tax=Pseudofrankia sp. BMG5.36 TaxID=1834512 RepID=UPI000AC0164F|nr:serine/threonine-protein kinase [Pseudofrankia sp. BMG5.36]
MRRNQHQTLAFPPMAASLPAQQALTVPPHQGLTLPTHPTHPLGAVAADPLSADDPEELGSYQLIGRLGEGGMGTVYLGVGPLRDGQSIPGGASPGGAAPGGGPADDAATGGAAKIGPNGIEGDLRLVAIKMIRADLARLPEFRERFLREADVARRVARFCTAEVLEVVDPPDGPPYLVTEYIDGLTLTHAVLAGGPLRTGDLERLAVSVAAALTAIHGAGLVHRDLKPSNVILSSLGPRVIDFGIARATDAHGVLSHDIQRIGTPAFMAPEQANGRLVTAAADIFAWGGLVTYASTGVLPFGDGPTPVQLYRVVHLEPNLEGLGPALRPIVEHAMRKDPAQRPTAQELFLRLVGMGPPTHPDPAVSRAIRSGAIPGQPPAAGAGADTDGPTDTDPPLAAGEAGATGARGPAGDAAGGPGGVGAPSGGDGPAGGEALGGYAGPPDRTWRDRLRHGSLMITPLLALMLIAVLIPVVLGRAPAPSPTPAALAAEVAASADEIRSTDAGLADALSLAAFRINPAPTARASLRTSFAGAAASPLSGHTASVLGVAVSLDGRLAATASADGTTRLWDLAALTGQAGGMASRGTPSREAPSPARPPAPLAVLSGHDGWVTAAAFSPDGTLLATAGYDRTVLLWDVSNPASPVKIATLTGHEGYVLSVAFSADGGLLATSGHDDTARIWDVHDPRRPTELSVLTGHTGWVRHVSFSPDGRLLATASTDHTARLWELSDPRHPRELATLSGHTDYVWAVAFSPDGRQLATGGYDGTARLWDVTDPNHPRLLETIKADSRWVLALAFSPDGRMLATAGRDDTVHLWDLTTSGPPAAVGRLSGHTDWIQDLAFTPDGQSVLTAASDHTARLTPIDDTTLLATACRTGSNRLDPVQWQHYIPAAPYRPVC